MNIYEFYRYFGVDPDNVMNRLGSEILIKKYLLKLSQDRSFFDLRKAIDEKDYKEAFRAVHTLKGICLNLELQPLTREAVELTEFLRNYDGNNDEKLAVEFEKLSLVYTEIIEKIAELH